MWQLQALSTALNVAILSVYPQFNERIRSHFHRIITPLLPHEDRIDVIPILWTGNLNRNGTFQPNHFVPMEFTQSSTQQLDTKSSNHYEAEIIPDEQKQKCSGCPNDLGTNANALASYYKSGNTQKQHTMAFHCSHYLPKHYCCSCKQSILAQKPNKCTAHEKETHYLCSVCYSFQKKNIHSPISERSLHPGIIPPVLESLTNAEIHMVSLVHPYMPLLKLPVGGQYGQKG